MGMSKKVVGWRSSVVGRRERKKDFGTRYYISNSEYLIRKNPVLIIEK